MKNKFLSIMTVLCLFLLASTLAACSNDAAEDRDEYAGLKFLLIDDEYCVMGFKSEYDNTTNVVIPENYKGYPVTEISGYAFSSCAELVSVYIPNSVSSIGPYAFSDCVSLTAISFSNAVNDIGRNAFESCSSLTSFSIPSSITTIKDETFRNCKSLTSVDLPSSIEHINAGAFLNCTSLISIEIPDSVWLVKEKAFMNCFSLVSAVVGSNVFTIETDAFKNCPKLVEIKNNSWFLNIRAGETDNGSIGYYAKHIYDIGESQLTERDGFIFYHDDDKSLLLGYCGKQTDLTLPDGFTAYNGDVVTEYDVFNYAFLGQKSLCSVTFDGAATSIGNFAFALCRALRSVVIGAPVARIGFGAFAACNSLTSLTVGKSVTDIAIAAFLNSLSLDSVKFEDAEGWQISKTKDFAEYVSLESAELNDPQTAANYIKLDYFERYWRKVK